MKELFFWAIAAVLLSACDLHSSDNGSLDGYWQLAVIDTIGGNSVDVRENKLFWAVQGDLVEMRHLEGIITDPHHLVIHWRFSLTGDQLTLSTPTAYDRTANDSLVTSINTIRAYGMNNLNETFKVLKLDGKGMTLESPVLRLHFNRY